MKNWVWIPILTGFVSVSAWAQDTVASLCAQGVEGSYEGSPTGFGPIHINLFCLNANTMMGTLGSTAKLNGATVLIGLTNFNHVDVVDGQLQLTDFNPSDRPDGSSKGQTSILHADIAALKAGKIHGDYMRDTMQTPATLDATRTQKYATFAAAAKPIAVATIEGVYKVVDSPGGPDRMIVDMADDIPVVYYDAYNTGDTIHLLNSSKWDGSGLLSIATPEGNGGEGDDAYLFYLRGHMINDNEIEFYLISPVTGAQGPMHAMKTSGLR